MPMTSFRRKRQENFCKLEACLVYRVYWVKVNNDQSSHGREGTTAKGPFSVLLIINVPKGRTSPSFRVGYFKLGQTGSLQAPQRLLTDSAGQRSQKERRKGPSSGGS